MKPLLLSTYDIEGGASRATFRLHTGLRQLGLDSQMLVQYRTGENTEFVHRLRGLDKALSKLLPYLDQLPLRLYPQRRTKVFSSAYFPNRLRSSAMQLAPDLIHLHWVGRGFLRLESLVRFQVPMVCTLHDMWAFTGGCHYDQGCGRYTENCGNCPELGSQSANDLSRWIWNRKNRNWKSLTSTVITPSRWLADCARKSSLLQSTRIEVIPNGLDLEAFRPMDRAAARDLLSLPPDKRVVLFGAQSGVTDQRKGIRHLIGALHILAQERDDLHFVAFGDSSAGQLRNLFGDVDQGRLGVTAVGRLKDDISLRALYSAADVFVAPSVQENLANTVMEALACGTPCAAFRVGGMPDLISHEKTGYLAIPFDELDLARGIAAMVGSTGRNLEFSEAARKKVEHEYDIRIIARRHEALYRELMASKSERENS